MSYLSPLRLHFAGRFQANIPTINNNPGNYAPSVKLPRAQHPYMRGDCTWRLHGCRITAACDTRGRRVKDRRLTALIIADSDRQAPAKLVDLDPQQQNVSSIYGLEIRIADADGRNLMSSKFRAAPFSDLYQNRTTAAYGDGRLSASFQSILTDLVWDEEARRLPCLRDLYDQSRASNALSIKFNVDSYDNELVSPDFGTGRIVGTIGPWEDTEPREFVRGRHLVGEPDGKFNRAMAVVNHQTRKIYIDLGNSLPLETVAEGFADVGLLTLSHGDQDLGRVPYKAGDTEWYKRTAGIVEMPRHRRLTRQELAELKERPFALFATNPARERTLVLSEARSGLYCAPEERSLRLDPFDPPATVRILATRFGEPVPKARIHAFFDDGALQVTSGPPVAAPKSALRFPAFVEADPNGVATLKIVAGDPGRPREHIDGQIYAIRLALEETLSPAEKYRFVPTDVVSVRVWNYFPRGKRATWKHTVRPVFANYKRLYPVMSRFLDLTDLSDVKAHREALMLTFQVDIDHPNYMPVTRDLSPVVRKAILQWLRGLPRPKTPSSRDAMPDKQSIRRRFVAAPDVGGPRLGGERTKGYIQSPKSCPFGAGPRPAPS